MKTKTNLISKILKRAVIVIAALFIAAQFIRPAKTNPTFEQAQTLQSHAQMPEQVAAIFNRACQDCHSNETRWPWYSNVSPVSWFVIDHVNHGRRHFNASDWAQYDTDRANKLLAEIYEEVNSKSMPLSSYTLLHPEAKLSDEDIKTLCDWAKSERQRTAQTFSRIKD